jgi:hypothetical protein
MTTSLPASDFADRINRLKSSMLKEELADRIDAIYREFLRARDAEQFILYGPCHGTGLMEGEHPWIELSRLMR